MEFISQEALQYTERYSSPEDALLQKISAYTLEHHPQAQMLSGHVQGKFLEMMSILLQPRRILEIGTFMGYSAICLAHGLLPDGMLHTIELRSSDAEKAASFIAESPFANRIQIHTGNALEIIETLKENWDLVFIDADKVNYVRYYEMVLPQVRKGGLIIADNVLFHGEVLQNPPKGKNAIAIQSFNERVKMDERVEKLMLSVRDGLFLIRKI